MADKTITLKSDKEYFPRLGIHSPESDSKDNEMYDSIKAVADRGPGRVHYTVNSRRGIVVHTRTIKYGDGKEESYSWSNLVDSDNAEEQEKAVRTEKRSSMAESLRHTAFKYMDEPICKFPQTSYLITPTSMTDGNVLEYGKVSVFHECNIRYNPNCIWGKTYLELKNHVSNKFNTHLIRSAILGVLALLCYLLGNNLLGFIANIFDGASFYATKYPDPYLFVLMFIVAFIIGWLESFDFEKITENNSNSDNIFDFLFTIVELPGTVISSIIIVGASFLGHFSNLNICQFNGFYTGLTEELHLGLFPTIYFAVLMVEQIYEFISLNKKKKKNRPALIELAEDYLEHFEKQVEYYHKRYRFLKLWADQKKEKFPDYDSQYQLFCDRYAEVVNILNKAKGK
ncbi:MAG: hypothetical protein MJ094_01160 [Saccharofermentans sp.]|nr:hypothetical protein [Saccharofermentans sp.]